MAAVAIAMIKGLLHGALRDAILTHSALVEGRIPLFSSMAEPHRVAEVPTTSAACLPVVNRACADCWANRGNVALTPHVLCAG